MSVANFLDQNGQLRVDDAQMDVVQCTQIACATGMSAMSLALSANGGSASISVDASSNITAGTGRYVLDTVKMRPTGIQFNPALQASINPTGINGPVTLTNGTLKVSKTGTLYHLTGTLSTSLTFATAPTIELFLSTSPTGQKNLADFAINSLLIASPTTGVNTLVLDLWAYSSTAISSAYLNVTATSGVDLRDVHFEFLGQDGSVAGGKRGDDDLRLQVFVCTSIDDAMQPHQHSIVLFLCIFST